MSPSSVLPMSTAMAPASWHRLATCTNLPAHVRVHTAVRQRVHVRQRDGAAGGGQSHLPLFALGPRFRGGALRCSGWGNT